MSGFFELTSAARTEHTVRIKTWVRDAFELSPDTPVLVTELACSEPGCPPVETVIAVMDESVRPHKLHRPTSEITQADVLSLRHIATERPATKEEP